MPGVERMTNEPAGVHQVRQERRAGGLHHENACREQREASAAGDDQRLRGSATRCRTVVLESNEQIRRESCELPEHEQQDDVVAEDEAEHGPHEREQRDVELADVGMGFEVLPRVDDDQRANGSDEDREQHTEAVEPKRQRQIERWSPGCRDVERPAAADRPRTCTRSSP